LACSAGCGVKQRKRFQQANIRNPPSSGFPFAEIWGS
jgi:hypothetical protein